MEERELEIVDLGGKETSEERVGFLDIIYILKRVGIFGY